MKVTVERTIRGIRGTANELHVEFEEDDPVEITATVSVWFIIAPRQTPFWDKFLLSIVHLRDLPGAHKPEANIRVPGATHEVILHAILPPPDNHPDPVDPSTWLPLTPLNLNEQVQLDNDEQAKELASHCAQAVVEGILWAEPPLSGQVEPWRTSLIKSSAHLRGEEHAS